MRGGTGESGMNTLAGILPKGQRPSGAEQPHAPQGCMGSRLGSPGPPSRGLHAVVSEAPVAPRGPAGCQHSPCGPFSNPQSPRAPSLVSLAPGPPGPASSRVTSQSFLLANSCACLKSSSRVTSSRKPQVLRRQGPEQGLHGPLLIPPRG